MSKIYQPIKNNPYRLRDRVYNRTFTDIRDVGKYLQGWYVGLEEYAPTAETVEAVIQALEEVPEEYRQMIFDNIVNETAYTAEYRNKTTTLEKAKYIQRVAELLGRPLGAREIWTVEYDWR